MNLLKSEAQPTLLNPKGGGTWSLFKQGCCFPKWGKPGRALGRPQREQERERERDGECGAERRAGHVTRHVTSPGPAHPTWRPSQSGGENTGSSCRERESQHWQDKHWVKDGGSATCRREIERKLVWIIKFDQERERERGRTRTDQFSKIIRRKLGF